MTDPAHEMQPVISAVNSLAAEVARLTKVREEEQSKVLAEHGKTLNKIEVTLARVDERTGAFADSLERLEDVDEKQQAELDEHSTDLNRVKGIGTGVVVLLGTWEAIRHWVMK